MTNGGSNEYFNLMERLQTLLTLIQTEFAKKLAQTDIDEQLAAAVQHPVVLGTAFVMPLPGSPFQPTNLIPLVDDLVAGLNGFKTAASGMITGGIGGLVNFAKAVIALLGKVLLFAFAILMAIFFIETEIQRISAIVNSLLQLPEQVAQLQATVNTLATDQKKAFEQSSAVALGIASGVQVANNRIVSSSTGLATLAKNNHAVNVAEFKKISTWQNNNKASVVATLTVAGVNAPNGLLDKTNKAVQATQTKLGEVATSMQNNFNNQLEKLKKVGSMIDVGRILDVITLIGVIHNAAMLSSSLGQTFFQIVDNGLNFALNAFGVKDIDDQGVNSSKAFAETVDSIGKQVFGVATWEQLKAGWAKANKIVSTGSTLLWSVRDLMDNTQNLAELAAENSGKVGNLLRRSGIVGDEGPWFPENYTHRTVLHKKLTDLTQYIQNFQNTAQVFEEITQSGLEIQENIQEIQKNNEEFQKALQQQPPKPTTSNTPLVEKSAKETTDSQSPEIKPEDLPKPTPNT
jgi:hypothetical protein